MQVVLERLLPCELGDGQKLPDGSAPLKYRLNGHLAFWASCAAIAAGEYYGLIRIAWLQARPGIPLCVSPHTTLPPPHPPRNAPRQLSHAATQGQRIGVF